ncbi:tRNA 2-thiouridine(34) synthase MnmA [Dethiosulfatarculus sandiegensis]|uniref:tRNA-specific 2-thiouridylase MnmA n=1 Tax=Dethiosulfatarculus sandiegensis TaxID=1429043 RepID=A0A0D2HXV5_9BACT|nr:tRNA 2-thiouridine(34) synthase MnmA [Dethiosulfatarculus sandiegensis]KIX15133.1 thiouridylase [Dethiosulfatarculus sandiegensis]
MARIGVAISGGVDSTAALILLKEQGHEVQGFTLKLGLGPDKALEPGRQVARHLGISHTIVDVAQEFADRVAKPVAGTYAMGKTPNPCVVCNERVKIPLLLKAAREKGCEKLATGHYARLEKQDDTWLLKEGLDPQKSQAYFLARVPAEMWDHILFPLGGLTKVQAREIVQKAGIESFDSTESQDLCFLPSGGWDELLTRYGKIRPGVIQDLEGNVLAEHQGIHKYTVGQRRGIGVALGYPGYVISLDGPRAKVTVGPLESLMARGFWANKTILNSGLEEASLKVRYRYNQAGIGCRILPQADRMRVEFESPQRAAPPGQLAVIYHEDTVVGSAWITEAIF